MILVDTHCHLDFLEFDSDRNEVIKRAKESGVEYIINVGSEVSETINNMATLIQERCKEVLGFNPIFEHLPGNATNVVQTLNYGTLYPSIFAEKIQNNKNREIDSLLRFCHDSFAIKSN